MHMHFIILLGAIAILLQGCITKGLWEETDPRERVFISHTQVTEEQLKAKHIDYIKWKDELGEGYLVKKSQARQLGDIALRIFASPITVTIDAATTIAVIGVVALAESGYSYSGKGPF